MGLLKGATGGMFLMSEVTLRDRKNAWVREGRKWQLWIPMFVLGGPRHYLAP